MRLYQYAWVTTWCWAIGDTEWRVDINPLCWLVGFFMGPLGVSLNLLCFTLGVTWGPYDDGKEAHEREMLRYLKSKYE